MYDLFVVGGGPAGYVAAIRASQLGMKVGLAEKKYLGGTCTNVGCIPTKAWLASAELFEKIKNARKFGITAEKISADMKKIASRTKRIVLRNRKGIEYLMKKNGVDLFTSHAELKSDHEVKLPDKSIETRNVLLCQGSHPIKFPPFDVEGVMTSDEVFSLEEFPKRLLIVGGGVIGMEMATFFSSFDCEVSVVEIMDHVLPTMDADVAEIVATSLKKRGVKIYESTKTLSVVKKGDAYVVEFEGSEKFMQTFDKILLSVGRKSNVFDDVKSLGIKLDKRGNIVTNEKMRTNVESVYAAGDINGKYMLAHVASKEGIVAVSDMNGKDMNMDYKAVPSVVFSDPEIATVGKSEYELKKMGLPYKKGVFPMSALGRARTLEESAGFAKILSDEKGVVVGLSIVGPMVTEILMEGVIAVQNGFTLEKLVDHIHPHPTISEIVMQSAEDALGMPIDK